MAKPVKHITPKKGGGYQGPVAQGKQLVRRGDYTPDRLHLPAQVQNTTGVRVVERKARRIRRPTGKFNKVQEQLISNYNAHLNYLVNVGRIIPERKVQLGNVFKKIVENDPDRAQRLLKGILDKRMSNRN